MSQIYVFLGPNRSALAEERLRWTREFRARHGGENLTLLEGKDCSVRELLEDVSVMPFLSQKRLVVVVGLPKGKREDVASLVKSCHPSVLLLFVVEGELGKRAKRTALEREILSIAELREFPLLSRRECTRWMREYARSCGAQLEDHAAEVLLSVVGEDQAMLAREIEKLAIFASGRAIKEQDVQLLTACFAEREVWQLMDLLGAGRTDEAICLTKDLLNRGASPQAVWNMFLWMVQSLVKLKGLLDEGERNPWSIARELRMNTSGVRAMLPFANSLSRAALLRIVEHALAADRGLKTGQYRATADAAEEQMALLDRAIIAFAQ